MMSFRATDDNDFSFQCSISKLYTTAMVDTRRFSTIGSTFRVNGNQKKATTENNTEFRICYRNWIVRMCVPLVVDIFLSLSFVSHTNTFEFMPQNGEMIFIIFFRWK